MSSFLRTVGGFVWDVVQNTFSSYAVPLISEFVWQSINPLWQRYWPVTYQNILLPAYHLAFNRLDLLFIRDDSSAVSASQSTSGGTLNSPRPRDHDQMADNSDVSNGPPSDHEDINDGRSLSGSGEMRSQGRGEMCSQGRGSAESVTPEARLPLNIIRTNGGGNNNIYVAVKNTESSMDTLRWALNLVVNPSTRVCLIHVYPKIHYIPTPLGAYLLASQVNERYKIQEMCKSIAFLKKFLDVCSASQIPVASKLIEIDMVAKSGKKEEDMVANALLDHICCHNITKLVLGTNQSSLRKLRSRNNRNGIAAQILQKAPEFCEVKIICEGDEIEVGSMTEPPSPNGSSDSPNAEAAEPVVLCFCSKLKNSLRRRSSRHQVSQ